MAHRRLGHGGEARRWLRRGVPRPRSPHPSPVRAATRRGPPGSSWSSCAARRWRWSAPSTPDPARPADPRPAVSPAGIAAQVLSVEGLPRSVAAAPPGGPPMSARLVALNGAADISLSGLLTVAGRHPGCDARLDSSRVSRRHCCLAIGVGEVIVRDLGSTADLDQRPQDRRRRASVTATSWGSPTCDSGWSCSARPGPYPGRHASRTRARPGGRRGCGGPG